MSDLNAPEYANGAKLANTALKRFLWGVVLLGAGGWGWWSSHASSSQACPQSTIKKNPLRGLLWKPARWDAKIVKQHRAGSYTYLQVHSRQRGAHWVVVMGKGLPVGRKVRVKSYGARDAFFSRRLKRCFATLHFAQTEGL